MLLLTLATALAVSPDHPDSPLNRADNTVRARLHAEVGFLAPLSHTIQFDTDGTTFDYVKEGGQNNLFPVFRFSTDFDIGQRNTLVVLYQPLDLRTEVVIDRDITEAGVTFPSGTPMELRYGFSFWRGSWMYDLARGEKTEAAIGGSLQIRNATIDFASQDGTLFTSERDIGPVPLLKFRGRWTVADHMWVGTEIDGAYAPIKYINGSDTDVVGALLDASVRYGFNLANGADVALNVRYLAGGAEGTSQRPDGLGDGYTANWLHFATVGMVVGLR